MLTSLTLLYTSLICNILYVKGEFVCFSLSTPQKKNASNTKRNWHRL